MQEFNAAGSQLNMTILMAMKAHHVRTFLIGPPAQHAGYLIALEYLASQKAKAELDFYFAIDETMAPDTLEMYELVRNESSVTGIKLVARIKALAIPTPFQYKSFP